MKSTIRNDLSRDHVDSFLRSFFKREAPDPWPECSVAAHKPAGRASWFLSYGRLALVASVAILLVGYLFLAAKFPVASEPGLILNRNQTIGSKPGPKQRVSMPRGTETLMWEETPRERAGNIDKDQK